MLHFGTGKIKSYRMDTTPPSSSSLPFPVSWRSVLVAACLWSALPSDRLLPVTANMAAASSPGSKFKAAVYEHAATLPRDPEEVVSREEALRVMEANLHVYNEQASEARKQGADILVFPEDGLYGFQFTWHSMTPYLEFVPDPRLQHWVPCEDPHRFPETEVQHALSCMARNHSLYIVANIGDRQPCHTHLLPSCHHGNDSSYLHGNNDDDDSYDGHVQYNTNVAFDPTGKLIARYHKQHLFFEPQFDTPPTPELSTFDTPFGRWAMFTCFDILYRDPAVTLVRELEVANIAFPSGWVDSPPLLASVQFHSAFARGMGVNLLAANIHLPRFRSQGSGVYTPKGMATFFHNSTVGSPSKLLVTEIHVLHKPEPEAAIRTRSTEFLGNRKPSAEENRKRFMATENGKVLSDENWSSFVTGNRNEGLISGKARRGNTEAERSYDSSNRTSSGPARSSATPTSLAETAFVSELSHDLFNFVLLGESPRDTLSVCQRNMCCHLTYNSSSSLAGDLFALGAFDGLHTYKGTFYLQICALVRCPDRRSPRSCGQPTNQSATLFHSLRLRGEMRTEFVYPEVLLSQDGGQLALAEAAEWSFRGGEISSEGGLSRPLLSAALVGRWYDGDDVMDPGHKESVTSSGVG